MSNDRLDTLVSAFESELPRYLSELQEAWQGPRRGTRDAMVKIQEIAHKLSGSAGAYGYLGLADAAVAVAATAAEVLSHFGQGHNQIQQRLFGQLNALGAHLAMPVRVDGGLGSLAGPARDRQRVRHVVLVDDDVAYARLLQAEMRHFGFEVDTLTDLTGLTRYLDQQQPDLIVMDVSFPEGQVAGPKAVQSIRAHAHGRVPVIFISARDTIGSRLAAVRAGGEAFFVKPFDVAELMDAIDRILGGGEQAAYRIMVVDDAASLARLYASTLEQAGMIAQVVSNPLEVLEAMESFHPDLLLMDIYMPEISGVELARIIQQHRSYLGVPIVFLSAERDPVKQLEALGQGGDNFLTKPIEGAELVKAVSIRAHHYQTLRALMLKDSLTGLLNHSRVLEQLDHELRRATRLNQPLSVAMIDIDHFKSINDTWGHPVGDNVILTLARLLRERLRVSDVVGRYGGEEFMVVMPEAGLEDARRVIDSLRESFARISHRVGDKDFTVSFSAGVAQITPQCVDRALMEKADQALYQAKHSGRNRVCIAPLC